MQRFSKGFFLLLFIVRFSHGEVVYVSELREFLECDLSKLEEGSSCLTRHEDGIWYPAKITGVPLRVYFTVTLLIKMAFH